MRVLLTCLMLMIGSLAIAQNVDSFFNSGGNQFIEGNTEAALNTVTRGLKRFPNSEKLQKLKELLEQKQQEQQQQQDQQQQEQQNKDQQQQDQEQQNQDQQQNEEQQQQDKEQQQNEEQQQDQEQKEGEEEEKSEEERKKEDDLQKFMDKLKEMKISPEKAQMILEAMKNNEIQYVQQNKRKASKRKDRSKPDW